MCSLRGGSNKNPPLRPLYVAQNFFRSLSDKACHFTSYSRLDLGKMCRAVLCVFRKKKKKFGTVPGGEDVGRVPPPVWYKGLFCIQ